MHQGLLVQYLVVLILTNKGIMVTLALQEALLFQQEAALLEALKQITELGLLAQVVEEALFLVVLEVGVQVEAHAGQALVQIMVAQVVLNVVVVDVAEAGVMEPEVVITLKATAE